MTDYKKKQGKKNRASGAAFEKKTREDLESKGWFVDKWTNNVEFIEIPTIAPDIVTEGKLVRAKNKWNNFTKTMMMATGGFPDFIAFRKQPSNCIIGVESKVGKYLNPDEREKCKWLLDNKVFSKILIAYKTKENRKIVVNYKEFSYSPRITGKTN